MDFPKKNLFFGAGSYGFDLPASGSYANMQEWRNVSDIEIHQIVRWTEQWARVDKIENGKMTMVQPLWSINQANSYTYIYYPDEIVNAYELLDHPGEWYYDKTDGYLYYIPEEENNKDLEYSFILPKVETLISGNHEEAGGSCDRMIENIEIRGITFCYNTWLEPLTDEGWRVEQASVGTTRLQDYKMPKAAIDFRYCQNIVIEDCTITEVATSGIGIDLGVSQTVARGNTITNAGINGIQLGNFRDASHSPEDERIIVKDNLIERNYIENIGVGEAGSVGILCGYVKNTRVLHNTLVNLPYTAISVGWGHGIVDDRLGYNAAVCGDNEVMYNRIDNYLLRANDGGGIYTLGAQENSVLKYNYITRQNAGFGYIYLDNGTQGYTVEDNVLDAQGASWTRWLHLNCDFGPYHPWSARYNTIRYNYYADGMGTNNANINTVEKNIAFKSDDIDEYAQQIMACAGVNGADMTMERPAEEKDPETQYYSFVNQSDSSLIMRSVLSTDKQVLDGDKEVSAACYQWDLVDKGNGYVVLVNRQYPDRLLTLANNSIVKDNNTVVYWAIGDTSTQQFKIIEHGDGSVSLAARNNENLQLSFITQSEGKVLGLVDRNDNDPQQNWMLSPIVKAPYASLEGGVITSSQQVTLNSETENAIIYYSVDGTDPVKDETHKYIGAFTVEPGTILKMVGCAEGYADSEIVTIEYKKPEPVQAPAADIASGSYDVEQSVTLSCATEGATIFYTLDGSTPMRFSKQYTTPLVISKNTVLKAIAIKEGVSSEVFVCEYQIQEHRKPTEQYYSIVNQSNKDLIMRKVFFTSYVLLEGDEEVPFDCLQWKIEDLGNGYVYLVNRYYPDKILTMSDNSVSENNSTVVWGEIGDTTNQQFKVIQHDDGSVSFAARNNENLQLGIITLNEGLALGLVRKDGTDSRQNWRLNPVVKAPYATPDGGVILSETKVALESETENAILYYTTDGTDPIKDEAHKYKTAITVTPGTTVKVMGCADGHVDSEIVTIEFEKEKLPKVQEVEFETAENLTDIYLSSNTRGAAIYYTTDGLLFTGMQKSLCKVPNFKFLFWWITINSQKNYVYRFSGCCIL